MTEIEDQITWERPKRENPAIWPAGETMGAACPHCGAISQVQIAIVRELGDDVRPADCDACYGDFELAHDGSVRKLKNIQGKYGWQLAYAD